MDSIRKYFANIWTASSTSISGLLLAIRYLFEAKESRKPIGIMDEKYFQVDKGIVTLEYPHETLPVPDNARYRLHNEIDDCIVCDKCAKVCPVDCIDIDPIRSPEVYGTTSDGTAKRIYAAKFDIDMGKCCFCGLCTTVCPTECLTMTKTYDFSEFDVKDHTYSFANMSLVEIAEKRQQLQEFEEAKAKKAQAASAKPTPVAKPKTAASEDSATEAKPKFRPRPTPKKTGERTSENTEESTSKPKFRPKPVTRKKPDVAPEDLAEDQTKSAPKPKFRPKPMIKKSGTEEDQPPKTDATADDAEQNESKPKYRPKPMIKKKPAPQPDKQEEDKPVQENKTSKADGSPETDQDNDTSADKPKFRPRPMIKKKPKDDDQ